MSLYIFNKANLSILLKGLILLIVSKIFLYYVQYMNFMTEVSSRGKGVTQVGDEIFTSPKIILIEYLCVFITYGVASFYVAKKSKDYALKNSLILGAVGGFTLEVYSLLFNQEFIKEYFVRFFIEQCFGFFICLIVGFIFKQKSKPYEDR